MKVFKTERVIGVMLLSAALATTACKKDDPADNRQTSVEILATIAGITLQSCTVNQPYTPENGTLHLHHANVGSKHTAQFAYTDNLWQATAPLFWEDLPATVGEASHAFFALAPTVPAEAPSVAADQSTVKAYIASDQLMAYITTKKPVAKLPVALKHVLSQLHITINAAVADPTDPAHLDPYTATLAIAGAQTAYTLSYNAPTTDKPAAAVATAGAKSPITLIPYGSKGTFYAIIPVQEFAAKALSLTFTINNKTYTWTNSTPLTTVAGKNISIRLSVKKSGVSLNSNGITLTDWVLDREPIEEDIEMDKI